MADFDESKHPRDDDGEFTDKGGGYRQNASYSEILGKSELNENTTLTKQEYAIYSHYVDKAYYGQYSANVHSIDKNNRCFLIETNNRCVLVLDNNRFQNRKIKTVMEFDSYDEMFDCFKEWVSDD